MTYELPTTMIGLIGLAMLVFGNITKMRLQHSIQNKKITELQIEQRSQGQRSSEVHNQIVNDHPLGPPNLRDIIDELFAVGRDTQSRVIAQGQDIAAVRDRFGDLGTKIADVRGELHKEVERSKTVDSRVIDELAAERERSIVVDNELRKQLNTELRRKDDADPTDNVDPDQDNQKER